MEGARRERWKIPLEAKDTSIFIGVKTKNEVGMRNPLFLTAGLEASGPPCYTATKRKRGHTGSDNKRPLYQVLSMPPENKTLELQNRDRWLLSMVAAASSGDDEQCEKFKVSQYLSATSSWPLRFVHGAYIRLDDVHSSTSITSKQVKLVQCC